MINNEETQLQHNTHILSKIQDSAKGIRLSAHVYANARKKQLQHVQKLDRNQKRKRFQ